ncbi:TlpA family protein disulfide reductase [Flavobacterium sp.]|uniref:TlpA family protein disulfide reductase n=1 Tax=Flavobacterium sp. TaxID=239 RepID=UPI0038FCAC05
MKKILVLLITIIVISCSNSQKTEFSKEALDSSLVTTDAFEITFENILEKHKGKILLVEIWATWCGDCVKAMPKMHELQAQNPDIDFLFISMDKSVDHWKKGIEKYDLKGGHYMAKDQMNGVFAKAIDLDWIPRYIIVDQTGKIAVYKAIETDFDLINTTLKELKKQTINK